MSRIFNGTKSRLVADRDPELDDLAAFTFSAWWYIGSGGSVGIGLSEYFISKGFASPSWYLGLTNSGTLNLEAKYSDSSIESVDTTSFLVKDVWFHVSYTYDADNGIQLYWNGTKVSTVGVGEIGTPLTGETHILFVGNGDGVTTALDSTKAAEFGLWNTALSSTDISSLANKTSPHLVSPSSLLSAVHLLGFQNPEPDVSGNGRYLINGSSLCPTTQGSHVPGIIMESLDPEDLSGNNTSVLGAWTFDQTLNDAVRDNYFINSSAVAGTTSSYTRYRRYNLIEGKLEGTYGLNFVYDTDLDSPVTYRVEDGSSDFNFVDSNGRYCLSMGFWWNSPEPVGFTRHAVTRKTTQNVVPIIAKADSDVDDNGYENITSGEWVVEEIASSATQNKIRFAVCPSSNRDPTHFYESDAYDPGLHFVWITYRMGSSRFARVEIDGKGTGVIPESGTAPSNTTSEIRLNDIGYGLTSHKTRHQGAYMSDLIIRASSLYYRLDDGIRMMRYGWEFLTENSKIHDDFVFYGLGYHQPTTVDTTHVRSEGGDIIAAKSNGAILAGNRPLWGVERAFDNDSVLLHMRPANPDKVAISGGELEISGTSIRIP